eukprot:scaffold116964_cov63-Phaeocystis_antarctica.AAC.7
MSSRRHEQKEKPGSRQVPGRRPLALDPAAGRRGLLERGRSSGALGSAGALGAGRRGGAGGRGDRPAPGRDGLRPTSRYARCAAWVLGAGARVAVEQAVLQEEGLKEGLQRDAAEELERLKGHAAARLALQRRRQSVREGGGDLVHVAAAAVTIVDGCLIHGDCGAVFRVRPTTERDTESRRASGPHKAPQKGGQTAGHRRIDRRTLASIVHDGVELATVLDELARPRTLSVAERVQVGVSHQGDARQVPVVERRCVVMPLIPHDPP